MKIRKNEFYFFGVKLFVFVSIFFVFSMKVEAKSNIGLSQSILPVKFVYLDEKKHISRVWSNVQEIDSVYVVKFFSEKNKEELISNELLLSKFKDKEIRQENRNLQTLKIDFIENGNKLEEVHTFV